MGARAAFARAGMCPNEFQQLRVNYAFCILFLIAVNFRVTSDLCQTSLFTTFTHDMRARAGGLDLAWTFCWPAGDVARIWPPAVNMTQIQMSTSTNYLFALAGVQGGRNPPAEIHTGPGSTL